MAARQDEAAETAVFKALADATRRHILLQLRDGELSAGEVASLFPISGPSISRHLSVLKAAGLVIERRQANRIIYSLVADRLASCAGSFISAVCPEQVLAPHQGKKKGKLSDKTPLKNKRKPQAAKISQAVPPAVGAPAVGNGGSPPRELTATP